MKAIGCIKAKSKEEMNPLVDLELPIPKATGHDLLIEIKAIAVNPVDYKTRRRVQLEEGQHSILGWDASGIVKEVGDRVILFNPGDEVWFAGDKTRPGCNSEFTLVDERIVGLKPKSLSFEQAAALPLTAITAWELLFDRLHVTANQKGSLLITGAAGGVGSILVQLASKLTELTVIGTAGREESQQWIKEHGAHHVIDHNKPMLEQLEKLGIGQVDYVISLTHSGEHAEELVNCLKPQAKFALIDDPEHLDFRIFKLKSISIHWEMMFTRSMYKTYDMINQHRILTQVADLVDKGVIKTTLNQHFGAINAANLNKAHELLISGKSRGKIVLSGF
ncbi:zinc-binding alcohol dehydrogenase family protein [Legionella maceachernii]|uniref:Zinc-type alcohol dehydrogenase-like protein n=1 Tax=Legionella maceachernii TaxID=466 RepID=A0A0W0WE44_9GAMM|nr:zinc-binding alcohol dehydrogenase family protein [Legionella maceachernii]KTD30526.1 zinc binding dehydrogenase [Legionella maceachernii]SJZ65757.1 zinc-binding alcohol dehydrogenase family protein [Legionella maceachernii]SUP01923.1 Zinc-type alcohol dehydrogenase-like protein SA1988 [Legionella maceachernii]